MEKRLNSHEVAKWFIYHNPSLASGYIDENTKLNKLLYFSSLMYYCINEEILINEDFVAFPNGPVIQSVYRDYRYHSLRKMPETDNITGINEVQKQVLNIINFVYGEKDTASLVKESHEHSLWKDVREQIPNNPIIRFKNTESELITYFQNIYQAYKNVDFSQLVKEKIAGNIFYYNMNDFEMTDDVIKQLSGLGEFEEPQYLEMVDGEIVFS